MNLLIEGLKIVLDQVGAGRVKAFMEEFTEAKAEFEEMHGDRPVVDALRSADEYIHSHPWVAAGIATALGLVVGMLLKVSDKN